MHHLWSWNQVADYMKYAENEHYFGHFVLNDNVGKLQKFIAVIWPLARSQYVNQSVGKMQKKIKNNYTILAFWMKLK